MVVCQWIIEFEVVGKEAIMANFKVWIWNLPGGTEETKKTSLRIISVLTSTGHLPNASQECHYLSQVACWHHQKLPVFGGSGCIHLQGCILNLKAACSSGIIEFCTDYAVAHPRRSDLYTFYCWKCHTEFALTAKRWWDIFPTCIIINLVSDIKGGT
jgi:hypothetical protein